MAITRTSRIGPSSGRQPIYEPSFGTTFKQSLASGLGNAIVRLPTDLIGQGVGYGIGQAEADKELVRKKQFAEHGKQLNLQEQVALGALAREKAYRDTVRRARGTRALAGVTPGASSPDDGSTLGASPPSLADLARGNAQPMAPKVEDDAQKVAPTTVPAPAPRKATSAAEYAGRSAVDNIFGGVARKAGPAAAALGVPTAPTAGLPQPPPSPATVGESQKEGVTPRDADSMLAGDATPAKPTPIVPGPSATPGAAAPTDDMRIKRLSLSVSTPFSEGATRTTNALADAAVQGADAQKESIDYTRRLRRGAEASMRSVPNVDALKDVDIASVLANPNQSFGQQVQTIARLVQDAESQPDYIQADAYLTAADEAANTAAKWAAIGDKQAEATGRASKEVIDAHDRMARLAVDLEREGMRKSRKGGGGGPKPMTPNDFMKLQAKIVADRAEAARDMDAVVAEYLPAAADEAPTVGVFADDAQRREWMKNRARELAASDDRYLKAEARRQYAEEDDGLLRAEWRRVRPTTSLGGAPTPGFVKGREAGSAAAGRQPFQRPPTPPRTKTLEELDRELTAKLAARYGADTDKMSQVLRDNPFREDMVTQLQEIRRRRAAGEQ